ncbi:MAG: hypothetical protein ABIC82_06175, partial [bacterium]
MKKRFLFKSLFLSLLAIFIFTSETFGFMAYRDETKYCLQELQDFIKAGNTSVYGTHMYLNTKCIEHFENRTGIELSESAKLYIVLGGITADYDIAGSSNTRDNYNEVNWSIKLGDSADVNNLVYGNIIQSNKCANHFYNGPHYDPAYDRLTDFATDLKNVSTYQWAYDSPDNNFDFQDALKNRNFAYGWRAIGETLHLLADMGSPAHVRNDNHMPGYGEDYYEKELGKFSFQQYNYLFEFPVNMFSSGSDLKIAFDELQQYTSNHFFSDGTLFQTKHAGINLPKVGISDYNYYENGDYYILNSDGQKVAQYEDEYLTDYNYTFPNSWDAVKAILDKNDEYLTTKGTHEDLWSAVAPKIIGYGSGIIYEFVRQAYLERDFSKDDSNGWKHGNNTMESVGDLDSWSVRVTGENPGVESPELPFFMTAKNITLSFRAKILGNNSSSSSKGIVYLRDENGSWNNPVEFYSVETDGEYHTYFVDLSKVYRPDLKFNKFSIELTDGNNGDDEYWSFDRYELSNSFVPIRLPASLRVAYSGPSFLSDSNGGSDEPSIDTGSNSATYPPYIYSNSVSCENVNTQGEASGITSTFSADTGNAYVLTEVQNARTKL